jgi:hypothetical protein
MEMRGLHGEDKEQGETEIDLVYDLLKVVFGAVAIGLVLMPFLPNSEAPKEKKLACDVAEISPDFSPADREKCRQIRGHKL